MQDWLLIDAGLEGHRRNIPQNLLELVLSLSVIQGALPVNRLQHSLQTATRAYEANRNDEYIFMCLMHDVGCKFTDLNHGEIAAGIIRPYVPDSHAWTVLNHEIFQSYHYYGQLGLDKNAREQFVGHEFYEFAVEFCELFDSPSWDKTYTTKELNFFKPLVEKSVYAKTQFRKIKS